MTCPASVADWFNNGRAMCYYVCVILHVNDPYLSVLRVGYCVPLADFCHSLYGLRLSSLRLSKSTVQLAPQSSKHSKYRNYSSIHMYIMHMEYNPCLQLGVGSLKNVIVT